MRRNFTPEVINKENDAMLLISTMVKSGADWKWPLKEDLLYEPEAIQEIIQTPQKKKISGEFTLFQKWINTENIFHKLCADFFLSVFLLFLFYYYCLSIHTSGRTFLVRIFLSVNKNNDNYSEKFQPAQFINLLVSTTNSSHSPLFL